jgi:hypoxanthine phosphoribosyltransferase
MDANQAEQALREADCLFTNEQVQVALDKMAQAITAKLMGRNPLALCVMTGGIIPAGHLLTRLNLPLQIDYIHATRYRGETAGSHLQWLVRPTHSLRGREILIIDDIYDEGVTLSEIAEYCWAEGATEVYIAVLINKLHDHKHPLKVDFVGLETPDRYLFGYGMDYKDYLRNAPGIYAVKGM